jgi:cytidylate kinase
MKGRKNGNRAEEQPMRNDTRPSGADIALIRSLPPFVVAIDGPSAAGKSTIAKRAAEVLGIDYIDTGAMYRAVALKILRDGIRRGTPDGALPGASPQMLAATEVDQAGGRTLLDGEDVTDLIRTPEVTNMASRCSALPGIRAKLVALQRAMGEKKSVIMDGRDIGSNVFPNARFKFFITASLDARAGRRYKEMLEKGMEARYEDVLRNIERRDHDDSHRAVNPLVQTADAIEVVTDNLEIEEVLATVLAAVTQKAKAESESGEREGMKAPFMV